jgi:Peptidase family M1 domain/Carboxypeptidase regulatory-like domain
MPLRTVLLSVIVLLWSTISQAAIISGSVKDGSGAAVAEAVVTIARPGGSKVGALATDASGHFTSPDLPADQYTVTVRRLGFEDFTTTVQLDAKGVELPVVLTIPVKKEAITVSANADSYLNSEPTYRTLRTLGLGKTFAVKQNVSLAYDVGSFTFHSGTMTFLAPVNGYGTGAVFVGQGEFTLKPYLPIDISELKRRTGSEELHESFTRVVFRFTGTTPGLIRLTAEEKETPREAQDAWTDWQRLVRHRNEEPLSLTEALLSGGGIDNVDADILAGLYNGSHPPLFAAYIRGTQHKGLRFTVREHGGAIPQIDSPEETALLNYAPGALDDGIWYMAHLKREYEAGSANSQEERRFFAAKKFTIETEIGKNKHLTSVATIDLQPVVAGERIIKFRLLPNLRVSRISDEFGRNLYYIQESPKADGSLYVVLPEACRTTAIYRLRIEYAGDNVIHDAGIGSYYIGARESWYPSPNGFGEKSMYDLIFRVPKNNVVVSVGDLKSSSEEDNSAVTHWITAEPVAIAGFNYGAYKQVHLTDDQTHTSIGGYYLTELPDYLRHREAVQSVAPESMTRHALEVARAELQICNYYFGPDGFSNLYITEQPNFSFGQSWPNLVYLPISAYMDATQRYLLAGQISKGLHQFVQEVIPHEVSHQWWGHAVSWASYHDQWLSEGFAEFSAGLFVQQGQGPGHEDQYRQFWDGLRKEILEKHSFGASPNDAGPLSLGLRLQSPKNEEAYRDVVYPKGAYVLNMLRSLMYTGRDEKTFVDMMHDFVASHHNVPASTESFKAIAEKHMPKNIDYDNNGRLDWFFNEWVYGTEIPRYAFSYELSPAADGRVKAHITLKQSEVGPRFVMAVPLYAQADKKRWVRIGQTPIAGSQTRTIDADLPANVKVLGMDVYHEILQR